MNYSKQKNQQQKKPLHFCIFSSKRLCVDYFMILPLENRECHLSITQVRKKKNGVRYYDCQLPRWVIFQIVYLNSRL